MNDKSYVTLEQHVCVVCTTKFDTNALLLDQRIRPVFNKHTVTGWGMCPECQKKKDDGYIALVAIDPDKSEMQHNPQPDKVWRTGDIAWIRTAAWERVFNVPIPEKGVCWIDPQVLPMLQKMQEE